MDSAHVENDLVNVLFTEAQIQQRLQEMAEEIERDYEGEELLIVGILRGAVMVMADLARSFSRHIEMDWMAVSSYGSGTKSSGVVRILKDLDTDISGRHVVIVDEIIERLRDIHARTELSILLVEQSAAVAFALASYGFVLENGKVELEGATQDLRTNQKILELYLGSGSAGRADYLANARRRREERANV